MLAFLLEMVLRFTPFSDPWIPNWPQGTPVTKAGANLNSFHRVANFRTREGHWDVELLQHIFIEETVMAILLIKWPYFDCKDTLIWRGCDSDVFSVKSSYRTLFSN